MAGYEQDRICEIKSDHGYGTGYLLGRGLVLTALHVLTNERGVPGTSFKVRSHRAFRENKGASPATLIWPEAGQTRPDVAVLRVPDYEPIETARVPLGLGDLPRTEVLPVLAVGFPELQLATSGQRGTKGVRGQTDPVNWTADEEFEIEVTGRQPPWDRKWHGMSGAPLFSGDRLIGVIRTREHNGYVDFKAVRLDQLETVHPAFAGAVSMAGSFAATAIEEAPPDLGYWICLLARDRQESEFQQAYGQVEAQGALTFIVTGSRRQRPDELLNRFSRKTLPDHLGWPRAPAAQFCHIEWPVTVDDLPYEFSLLRGHLWNLLQQNTPAPIDPKAYSEKLADASRNRLFFSEIRRSALSEPEQAALLGQWLTFWGAIAPPGRPPVHAMLAPGVKGRDMREWLGTVPGGDLGRRHPLGELPHCTGSDLSDWLDQRLPARFGRRHADRLRPWGMHLQARLGADEFELQAVFEEIAQFVSSAPARGGYRDA